MGTGTILGPISSKNRYKVSWTSHPQDTEERGWEDGKADVKALYPLNYRTVPEGTYIVGIETNKGEFLSLNKAIQPEEMGSSKHGPTYQVVKANKHLYHAQLLSATLVETGGEPKVNKLVEMYANNAKMDKAIKVNWSSSASSAVQSNKWLLLSHALPVGARMKDGESCPLCGKEETIEHLFYKCNFAKGIWNGVLRQWRAKASEAIDALGTNEQLIMPGRGFWKQVCLGRKDCSHQAIWNMIASVTTFHIWRTRCAALYHKKIPPPPEAEIPFIWQHVHLTLIAEHEALMDIYWWWIKRIDSIDNPFKREACKIAVLPAIKADLAVITALVKTMVHPSQHKVSDRDDGISNTSLPYRNRYSNPYWYQNLVDSGLLEDK